MELTGDFTSLKPPAPPPPPALVFTTTTATSYYSNMKLCYSAAVAEALVTVKVPGPVNV